ncbi:hypothetical protein GW17_00002845 [Ensete ventricosum]|nr:hypothetical protein GW17_00002845 [Ensete ventricosum]
MRRCPVRYAIMRRGMIGATGKLDYFSAYIQLREPDKLEDKAEATNSWAMGWQRHGIAEAELRGVIDPLLLWRESVGRKRGGGGGECRAEELYISSGDEASPRLCAGRLRFRRYRPIAGSPCTGILSDWCVGEVIGALCIPVSSSASMLKRAASIKMLQQAAEFQEFSSYPLRCKNFEITDRTVPANRNVGFWVGLSPDGPWENFSPVLPLSAVVPKLLNKQAIAFEVIMRNSKKHAILRSLALLVNDADIKLEVSLFSSLSLSSSVLNTGTSSPVTVTEEVFENQRCLPVSGKSSSTRANDPARWSTRDYSYSSKVRNKQLFIFSIV